MILIPSNDFSIFLKVFVSDDSALICTIFFLPKFFSIGILHTNHGKIETPAFVPVIHPVRQTIPTREFRRLGFDLVITNAYLTRNHYGQKAQDVGIHKIIVSSPNPVGLSKGIAISVLIPISNFAISSGKTSTPPYSRTW